MGRCSAGICVVGIAEFGGAGGSGAEFGGGGGADGTEFCWAAGCAEFCGVGDEGARSAGGAGFWGGGGVACQAVGAGGATFGGAVGGDVVS